MFVSNQNSIPKKRYLNVDKTILNKEFFSRFNYPHVVSFFASIVHRPFLPVEQFRCVFCTGSQHEEQSTHIMRFWCFRHVFFSLTLFLTLFCCSACINCPPSISSGRVNKMLCQRWQLPELWFKFE